MWYHDDARGEQHGPDKGTGQGAVGRVHPDHARHAGPGQGLWFEHEQLVNLDLGRLLRVLWIRKWTLILTFMTITSCGLIIILHQLPRYQAVTQILIEPEQPIVEVRALTSPVSISSQAIASQIEVLRSRPLIERVVEKVGYRTWLATPPPPTRLEALLGLPGGTGGRIWAWLVQTVPWLEQDSAGPSDDEMFRSFYAALGVWRVPNTFVLGVGFETVDPTYAALVVNAVATEYIDSQRGAKAAARTHATALLTERLATLRARIDEAGQAVEAYRAQSGLAQSAGTELIARLLNEHMIQLADARAEHLGVDARRRKIEGLYRAGATNQLYELLNTPAVVDLRQRMLQVEREITLQSKRYGPNHPAMIELQGDLDDARVRLDAEIKTAIDNLRVDAAVKAQRVAEFERTTGELQQEMAGLNPKEYRLKQLEAETNISRALHDRLAGRIRETEDAVFEMADARVLSVARAPTMPVSIGKASMLLMVVAGAFCVSTGTAFAREFFNGGFSNEEDLAGLGRPVLATIPRASASQLRRSIQAPAAHGPHYGPAYAEAFHTLHTGLELLGLRPVDGQAAVLLVTSAVPGEGKSTVVGGLARLAAQVGRRVLIIDCDLRKPRVHRQFAMDNRIGLSACRSGDAESREALVRVDAAAGVHVITAGPVQPHPQRLLHSRLLHDLLASLRGSYDLILIDSAPVLAVADPIVVGRHCDAAVMVVKWSATSRRLVRRAADRLGAGGVPLAGSILTQIAPSAHKADNFGYIAYS